MTYAPSKEKIEKVNFNQNYGWNLNNEKNIQKQFEYFNSKFKLNISFN